MIAVLQFAFCAGLIVLSGSRLSYYGDVIAEKTGMGRTWIGVALMASATSLPELMTGISSVAVYNLPDIAVGNVLGACAVNLLVLGMVDIGTKGAPISSLTHQGQVLTAAFGMLLLGLVTLCLLAGDALPAVGWVGLYSFALLLLYLLGVRLLFKYEKRRVAEYLTEVVAPEIRHEKVSRAAAYRNFALHGAVVVAAAMYLPRVAAQVAELTGLGQTFVGTMFVALSTTLPEMVVTRAAMRMGAVDLAVANVLGSNLFNVAILAIDDLLYFPGPILSEVTANHAITSTGAMMMTAIFTIGLVYRAKTRLLFFSWESLGIFGVYALLVFLLLVSR